MLLVRLKVAAASRPSPSFARVELAGADLAEFGVDGPLFDQRIKLILPGPDGLPSLRAESWWTDFAALPEETRGAVRTYTIADVFGVGEQTRIVVDFVLHPGAHGPGSAWALSARAGDELLAVVPKRGESFGGIEFAPGGASRLLLIGDETALPAIVQILRELPAGLKGTVFLEVPLEGDIVVLPEAPGVEVTWLPRNGAPVGDLAVEAVGAHLGFVAAPAEVEAAGAHRGLVAAPAEVEAAGAHRGLAAAPAEVEEVDPDLWETPIHSSSGEALDSEIVDDRYAWIAGESAMVTRLRRHLVGELGIPRAQIAFMGYWRQGVAMRG